MKLVLVRESKAGKFPFLVDATLVSRSSYEDNGMSLRVKQIASRRALAPVLDECRAIGKPGLAPNG